MRLLLTSLLISGLLLSACEGGDTTIEPNPEATRSFKMGFTPWLYEASTTAQDVVYDQINNNADIISHHLMSGIPWQQALDGTPYPDNVENEIATRFD